MTFTGKYESLQNANRSKLTNFMGDHIHRMVLSSLLRPDEGFSIGEPSHIPVAGDRFSSGTHKYIADNRCTSVPSPISAALHPCPEPPFEAIFSGPSSPVAGQPEDQAPHVRHMSRFPPSGRISLTLAKNLLFFFRFESCHHL